MEGIDYHNTFALVARMESMKILIASPSRMQFSLYLIDVKSAFLNGY